MKDVMFAIMIASLLNFFAGSLMGPQNETEVARGFIGYSCTCDIYLWITND